MINKLFYILVISIFLLSGCEKKKVNEKQNIEISLVDENFRKIVEAKLRNPDTTPYFDLQTGEYPQIEGYLNVKSEGAVKRLFVESFDYKKNSFVTRCEAVFENGLISVINSPGTDTPEMIYKYVFDNMNRVIESNNGYVIQQFEYEENPELNKYSKKILDENGQLQEIITFKKTSSGYSYVLTFANLGGQNRRSEHETLCYLQNGKLLKYEDYDDHKMKATEKIFRYDNDGKLEYTCETAGLLNPPVYVRETKYTYKDGSVFVDWLNEYGETIHEEYSKFDAYNNWTEAAIFKNDRSWNRYKRKIEYIE